MDYSHVVTRDIAIILWQEGELVKILLCPVEFGGTDAAENESYVPATAAAVMGQFTTSFCNLIRDRVIDKVEIRPEYKGDSIVPAKLCLRAWHTDRPRGAFEPMIEVW